MGDLNIDTTGKTKDTYKSLSDLCFIFFLTNIINVKTCFTYKQGEKFSQDEYF